MRSDLNLIEMIPLSITTQTNDKYFGSCNVFPSKLINHIPPWLSKIPPTQKLSLHSDILHFIKYIQASQSEKQTRLSIIEKVTKVIDSINIVHIKDKYKAVFVAPKTPSCVTLYGSLRSDLVLPFSDIDISISGQYVSFGANVVFPIISSALINACVCEEILSLPNAKVPVLKMRSIKEGFDIDFTINNLNGITTTKYISRLCHKNSMLRPLVIIIRYLLHQGGFTNVVCGGLNTFMITLMTYSFLTMYNTGNVTGGKPDTDLGSVLVTFLQHFGYDFDYCTYGISVQHECCYFEKNKRGWLDKQRPMMLTIENPFDSDINLTPNAFLTPQIKDYFAKCLQWILPLPGDDMYYFQSKNSRLARIIHMPN
ncbi:Topoisomerase [Entamoeba marina]